MSAAPKATTVCGTYSGFWGDCKLKNVHCKLKIERPAERVLAHGKIGERIDGAENAAAAACSSAEVFRKPDSPRNAAGAACAALG